MEDPEKRWFIDDKIFEKIKLSIIKKDPMQKLEDERVLGKF